MANKGSPAGAWRDLLAKYEGVVRQASRSFPPPGQIDAQGYDRDDYQAIFIARIWETHCRFEALHQRQPDPPYTYKSVWVEKCGQHRKLDRCWVHERLPYNYDPPFDPIPGLEARDALRIIDRDLSEVDRDTLFRAECEPTNGSPEVKTRRFRDRVRKARKRARLVVPDMLRNNERRR